MSLVKTRGAEGGLGAVGGNQGGATDAMSACRPLSSTSAMAGPISMSPMTVTTNPSKAMEVMATVGLLHQVLRLSMAMSSLVFLQILWALDRHGCCDSSAVFSTRSQLMYLMDSSHRLKPHQLHNKSVQMEKPRNPSVASFEHEARVARDRLWKLQGQSNHLQHLLEDYKEKVCQDHRGHIAMCPGHRRPRVVRYPAGQGR